MKKNLSMHMILGTAALVGVGFQTGLAEEENFAPKEPVVIQGKKPVSFNHVTHLDLEITCGQCHHKGKKQKLTNNDIGSLSDNRVLQCANCHTENFFNPKLRTKKDVFHQNCRSCHKKGFNDKKGPTKCSGCHPKKKKQPALEGC